MAQMIDNKFKHVNDSSPKNENTEEWEDAHIYTFTTHQYPNLFKDEEIHIATEFITFLFTGNCPQGTNLKNLLFHTASFLREPNNEKTKLLIPKVCKPESHTKYRPSILYSNETFLIDLKSKEAIQFRVFLLAIKRTGIITFAAIMATILLRLSVKPQASVTLYLKQKSTVKFQEYFPKFLSVSILPPISEKAVSVFAKLITITCKQYINHLCLVLDAFKTAQNVTCRQYLSDLFLTHTSQHGMRLIRDYSSIKHHFDITPTDLLQCLNIVPDSKHALLLLHRFQQKYADTDQMLWPWAHIIKSSYFCEYNVSKHPLLATVFVALLEEFDGPFVWKSRFLHDVPLVTQQAAKTIALVLRNTLRNAKRKEIGKKEPTLEDSLLNYFSGQ